MRSTLLYVFIAVILMTLGACLPTGEVKEVPVAVDDAKPFDPIPGLTPNERRIRALGLMEKGRAEEARAELVAARDELPADKKSRILDLISQIDDDPVKSLGSKNFEYKIAKGESLSIIAERYLGDPFKFYVLARYNDLDNPSLVNSGDVIKVPGKKPDVVATQEPVNTAKKDDAPPPVEPADTARTDDPAPPAVPVDTAKKDDAPPPAEPTDTAGKGDVPPDDDVGVIELLAKAEDKVNVGNYQGAIIDLEKGLAEFPDSKVIADYAASVYVKHGEELRGQGKYTDAQSALQQASILDPANKDVIGRLAEADRAAKADDIYREGLKYNKKDAKIDAYESYKAALKVWSAHEPAQIEKARISPQVADIYYREGKIAFQRQDLEGALIMYDKTLEVDPGHEPAKLNRQQTIELLDKIKGHSAAGEQDGT